MLLEAVDFGSLDMGSRLENVLDEDIGIASRVKKQFGIAMPDEINSRTRSGGVEVPRGDD